jgi:hypothetical protein
MQRKLSQYTTVPLTADVSQLSDRERQQMIPLLIEAAYAMDEIFWMEPLATNRARINDQKRSK